jgi:hypothetical protein
MGKSQVLSLTVDPGVRLNIQDEMRLDIDLGSWGIWRDRVRVDLSDVRQQA